MKAEAVWQSGSQFTGRSHSGHTITFDTGAAHEAGPSPMEAVLCALCACTSVDVVSVLQKKREPLEGLTVRAVAEQATEAPRVFTRIKLTYAVQGTGLSRKAIDDAIALSKNKYCSVSIMLRETVDIHAEAEYGDAPLP